jgi:hypothetical protein
LILPLTYDLVLSSNFSPAGVNLYFISLGGDFEYEEDFFISVPDLRQNPVLMEEAKEGVSFYLGADLQPSSSKSMGARILFLKKQAWADSTWRGMRTSLLAYFLFCFFYDFKPFPPTEFVLVRFAACLLLSFKTAGAISTYISSVRSVFTFVFNVDPPKTGPELSLILRGFRRFLQHRVHPVDALLPDDLL